LGNMISSPSAQIVNALAESNFVTSRSGKRVDAYGPVMGIATAIIATGIAVTAAVGPEKRGRLFDTARIAGAEEYGPGKDVEDGFEESEKPGAAELSETAVSKK
ncbi:hypothetical protein LTS18_012887, partial [Coniosporium uncinatum]